MEWTPEQAFRAGLALGGAAGFTLAWLLSILSGIAERWCRCPACTARQDALRSMASHRAEPRRTLQLPIPDEVVEPSENAPAGCETAWGYAHTLPPPVIVGELRLEDDPNRVERPVKGWEDPLGW